MESSKVKVNILGQTYSIKGDAPPEYIMQLADYVNEKVEEVSRNVSSVSTLQMAILVSLNIADEYYQLKRINTGIEGAIEDKARAIISLLDEGLIGDIFSGAGAGLER
ncbi:MAG TPA: cell division protein ZapA [Spirochaetota bacterium]|nr:cell division protein ZapA [Spirochaetota bacterium]HPJ33785.1 cell division protein ZapA [Spirochaetota bacterium]